GFSTLSSLHSTASSTASIFLLLFFNDTPPSESSTLSLHDALPISCSVAAASRRRLLSACCASPRSTARRAISSGSTEKTVMAVKDRKSTRLNSSHLVISYAVFCLKKKKNNTKV